MTHHVLQLVALQYLETARHTRWQTAYRMHTAGSKNMQHDAKARGWHMWRIALEDLATGRTEGYLAQSHGDPTTFETFPSEELSADLSRPFREELTAVGIQYVLPGCDKQAPKGRATAQLSLW